MIAIVILLVCFNEISELNDRMEDMSRDISVLKSEISTYNDVRALDGDIIDFKPERLHIPSIKNGVITYDEK